MKKLCNFLSFFITLQMAVTAIAQDNLFPKQILNLSSDERVTTNALLADKSKRQLSVIDSKCLAEGTIKEQYNIDIGKKSGDKKSRDDRRTPEGMYILLERK